MDRCRLWPTNEQTKCFQHFDVQQRSEGRNQTLLYVPCGIVRYPGEGVPSVCECPIWIHRESVSDKTDGAKLICNTCTVWSLSVRLADYNSLLSQFIFIISKCNPDTPLTVIRVSDCTIQGLQLVFSSSSVSQVALITSSVLIPREYNSFLFILNFLSIWYFYNIVIITVYRLEQIFGFF